MNTFKRMGLFSCALVMGFLHLNAYAASNPGPGFLFVPATKNAPAIPIFGLTVYNIA